MRTKTLRWTATAALALAAACEPVGLDGAIASADPADAGAAVARARVMLARTPENMRMHRLSDGTQLAEIVRGFQHATIVTKSDAGLERHCLTDPEEAVRVIGIMTATRSPRQGTSSRASSGAPTLTICLPLRVLAIISSSLTMKP